MIEADGAPTGFVARHEIPPAGGGWWELGIRLLDPERWGRGIGREALTAWTEATFAETGATVLTLTTWSGNTRMIACARRTGFVECGRVPQARAWDSRRWDAVQLARVRPALTAR